MQKEMGMVVVSRVFPGEHWGDLVLSCVLMCPSKGVKALKCHVILLEVTMFCPWLTICLAKREQRGAVTNSCDFSPHGVKARLGDLKSDGKRPFPVAMMAQ